MQFEILDVNEIIDFEKHPRYEDENLRFVEMGYESNILVQNMFTVIVTFVISIIGIGLAKLS